MLHSTSLKDEPSFDALSYCWEDTADGTEWIKLDGVRFDVTENLLLALRYLRHPNDETSLWADAMCFDKFSVSATVSTLLLYVEA
jgi:hypothetical protein